MVVMLIDVILCHTAHLSGQAVPLPEESRSPSITSSHANSPSSFTVFSSQTDPTSPYDNLNNLGLAESSPQSTKTPSSSPGQPNTSSSSPNMQKPKRPSLQPPGATPGSYINMNFPAKVPPKKPARSSIGIMLDRDSTEETMKDESTTTVVVPSSASMYELGQSANNSTTPNQGEFIWDQI